MYSNMGHIDKFRESVIKDDRSYSNETFKRAVNIINSAKKGVFVDQVCKEKFEKLAAMLVSMKSQAEQEDVSSFSNIFANSIFM